MNNFKRSAEDVAFPEDAIPVLRPDGTLRSLAEIEEAMIDYAVQAVGSRELAANLLGIGRATLYRHLQAKRKD